MINNWKTLTTVPGLRRPPQRHGDALAGYVEEDRKLFHQPESSAKHWPNHPPRLKLSSVGVMVLIWSLSPVCVWTEVMHTNAFSHWFSYKPCRLGHFIMYSVYGALYYLPDSTQFSLVKNVDSTSQSAVLAEAEPPGTASSIVAES